MKLSEKIFFLAYGIYLIIGIISVSFYSSYIRVLIKPAMIVCALIEVYREFFVVKLSRKELFFMLSCIILSLLLLMHLNGIIMLPFFLLIYGARNVDFKKILKVTVWVSSILLILVIVSAKLEIIPDYILTDMGRERDCLGFKYPLIPQMILFNITLSEVYIKKEKPTIISSVILIVINYIMFKYTNSRLSFYLSTLLIIIIYCIAKKPKILKNKKLVCYILILSFPIFCIFSLYTTYNFDYSNPTMRNLNTFLGGRLKLGKNSFDEYPINLFGNHTEYIGAGLDSQGKRSTKKYNYVDCMYINLLEKYGIIFNVVLMVLLTYLSYSCWKDNDYVLLIILFGLAAHGVIDDLEMYLYFNAFWLSISIYFNKEKSGLKNMLNDEKIYIEKNSEV